MGIKQHCLDLERDGYLDTWRRPKPVGRPEMLYRLTKRGETLFPEVHNPLSIEILETVQQAYGTAAPTKVLFSIFNQRAETYRARLSAAAIRERAAEFTDLRAHDGYMSQFGDCGYGPDHNPTLLKPCIVERHSPIEDVLRRYPIIARLEKEMFERGARLPGRTGGRFQARRLSVHLFAWLILQLLPLEIASRAVNSASMSA